MRALAVALLALALPAAAAELPPAPDPSAVTAADDARARELFENGAALYEEGRYEDAIVAWREAWRLSGRPLLLFNMANAAERLARWDEAIELLSRYRAFAPADERETLERRIRNLERRVAETAPASGATPDGAAADGAAADGAAGAGGEPGAAGAEPAAGATPATGTDGAAGGGAPTAAATASPGATAPAAAARPRGSVVPVALLSVGGVGLGTGLLFGLRALDARADAEALCVGAGGDVRCPDAATDALAADRADSLAADIAFGVGGAAIVGGIVALIVGPEAPVLVSAAPTAGGGWVGVGGVLP